MILKKLAFYDLEGFCEEVSQWFDQLDKEEFEDIAIIAKYEEAKEIIENLIVDGFTIHSIDIHDEGWEGYSDEYIITLINVGYGDELFCEPMKRDGKYILDDSTIMYILDNCSSNVIPYCKGKTVYEVAVGYEEDEFDDKYDCANCVLDDCVRCGCGELESKDGDSENDNKDAYTITVKCHLDTDEAEKIISDMEKRVEHMNDMFAEMDAFRRLFRW